MSSLKKGTTLIELIIYVGLLGFLATILFGLVLQINRQNKGVLAKHVECNATQIALDLMARDIRDSKMIDLKKNPEFNLSCWSELGTIKWKLDQDHVLFRIDHQTKLKKPTVSKVAENIEKITILQVQKKIGNVQRGQLIRLKLINNQKMEIKRSITLRPTLIL